MVATTKAELLETLQAEREQWNRLIESVGDNRMNWDGAIGDWSIKDITAHLAAWQDRVVAWLEAIRDGGWPRPPAWRANMSEDEINAWIFKSNHALPVNEVKAESERVFQRLLELVQATSEQDLISPSRCEWLEGESVVEAMPGDSYEHYQEHAAAIRAWLEQLPNEAQGANTSFS